VSTSGKKNPNRARRALLTAFAVSPLAAPLASLAQSAPAYTELKPPLPSDGSGKIEVVEFFWYGCPHCYRLEPKIETWVKKLPPEAVFRRVPAVFNERWALDATIFYAFDALGVLPKLHWPLFEAIHRNGLVTSNRQALDEWLTKNGVDAKKFEEAAKSFGVQAKVRRAARLTLDSKIDGTPAMTVAGRYLVPNGEQILGTVDKLIDVSRKQK
jgi:thiol:disulfide interchange protein DsbA